MISRLCCFGLLIFLANFIFSQDTRSLAKPNTLNADLSIVKTTEVSNIVRMNGADTAFFKLIVKGAYYDPTKNNFPYYGVAKTTDYEQSASPTLLIKTTKVVAEPYASAIRKFFGNYLSATFEKKAIPSLSRNENLNHHQIFPFRINASQQIEELIDYDVNWQISRNNNRSERNSAASAFLNNSVLRAGNWHKIGVTQSGIHRINKSLMASMGLDISKIDPSKIRLYGNGGKMLPERNGDFRFDDLQENAITIVGGSDNVFNDNDYILFYASGPNEWKKNNSKTGLKFSAIKNLYSDTSYYFLTVDPSVNGKRITVSANLTQSANISTSSYDYYNFHEEELYNFIKSGRNFFGENFDINTSYNFNWNDGDFLADSILAEAQILNRSRVPANYLVSGNGLNFAVATNSTNVDYYLAPWGNEKIGFSAAIMPQASPNINITITKQTASAIGWLDKLTINARRSLNLNNRQFQFRDTRTVATNNVCEFLITAPITSTPSVWNVTDPLNPTVQAFSASGATISFKIKTDSLREFCIAPVSDFYTPVYFGKVPNQNLHSFQQADYVIITHPLFTSQAQRMAKLHAQQEGLTSVIATTDQIYNEFSSGRPDISALRDFVRMIYSRNTGTGGKQIKYLLLMGDGSYKNKSRSLINNSNLIPTYQSQNSLEPTNSLATDDFYGLMDADEGSAAEDYGKLDIGVGRFTCRSTSEMNAVVNKVENYYKKDPNYVLNQTAPEGTTGNVESNLGDWRTWLMFLSDDQDGAEHMRQSDSLTKIVQQITSLYNIDKIPLDAYKAVSTPGGKRYPDAAEELKRRMKKGVLVFNYTGHGGEVGLTEERVLDIATINGFDNNKKLALFVTATCEFSRYDDPDRTSAGELCLLNPEGGAIALFTTCRVAYSYPNFLLNESIFRNLFTKTNNVWPTLGDAFLKTKSNLRQIKYYANFHLLGDPAMPLAYPQQNVVTSVINNKPAGSNVADTLGALQKITISGFVADNAGNKLSTYNGIVYPSVFDKERIALGLVNDEGSINSLTSLPFQFNTQKNILFRGKSKVTNGDFSFTFMVPKDISFAPGRGRISYYATDGKVDAAGSYSNLIVGGSSQNIFTDNEGPQIKLYLNDKNFLNGGTTNEKPILFADLVDSSGINTVGNAIGHDISLVLDAAGPNPLVLNDYYEANLNSYQSGQVKYPFNELSEGPHRLTFKVWDIQNNSSTAYSDFIVAKSAEVALNHVLNYPNPFTSRTKFYFEHNQAGSQLKITIQIFTISGKAVKTIQKTITDPGFRPEGIEWDGTDEYGDKLARGVYIYKLAILDNTNKKAEKIEKLVILN